MTARASGSKSARLTMPASRRRPRRDRGRRSPDEVEVGQADEHRLAPDRGVLERDRDLLVAAGQLAGDDDAVAPAGVADPVAVAELALAGDDRAGGPWRASPAAGRRASRSSSQARTGRAREPDDAPSSYASRLAARSRPGRNVSPAGGAPGRPLPCRKAAPLPARRPGRASRTGSSAAPRRRGRGRGPGRPSRRAAGRPSARPGSRAGTATAPTPGPSPRSRGARRATGTAAAWRG